ncbi:hypothetical protein [Nonomuraea roseola]|uniref:Uncharacterized protein n=1 Tax=Nonomuraea roseola TaxID=46179 RepID=A0ABV5QB12_9ACTN
MRAGSAKLATAYGAMTDDPTSTVLLRHRAVMLALLGGALLAAAFLPALRMPTPAYVRFGARPRHAAAEWRAELVKRYRTVQKVP